MLTIRISLVATLLAGGTSLASSSDAQDLPLGNGRDTVKAACTTCHGIDLILSRRRTQDEWRDVVSQMVGNGASMTDDQFSTVMEYLSTALAPDGAASNSTAHTAPKMPRTTASH